jgi:hypothetical protein
LFLLLIEKHLCGRVVGQKYIHQTATTGDAYDVDVERTRSLQVLFRDGNSVA